MSVVDTFGELLFKFEFFVFVKRKIFGLYCVSIHSQEVNCVEQIRARQYCAQFTDDSDDNSSVDFDKITITLPSEGHGKRSVLTSMLAPYSYTYLTVVRSLDKLLNHGLIESDFVRLCIQEITRQVESGQCKYGKFSLES